MAPSVREAAWLLAALSGDGRADDAVLDLASLRDAASAWRAACSGTAPIRMP
jgi:hypothetical protein